jgi:hypothetical protein
VHVDDGDGLTQLLEDQATGIKKLADAERGAKTPERASKALPPRVLPRSDSAATIPAGPAAPARRPAARRRSRSPTWATDACACWTGSACRAGGALGGACARRRPGCAGSGSGVVPPWGRGGEGDAGAGSAARIMRSVDACGLALCTSVGRDRPALLAELRRRRDADLIIAGFAGSRRLPRCMACDAIDSTRQGACA